jgi:hypothetical protein
MRISTSKPFAFETPSATKNSNKPFFDTVSAALKGQPPQAMVLLVGGSDWRSLGLRHAQATLRFDRRPSAWSHAALILDWDGDNVARSSGVEASLDPEQPQLHVPERDGVTAFSLRRYFDALHYPNVCLAAFTPPAGPEGESGLARISEAARNPQRDGIRFPVWDAFGAWHHYLYQPYKCRNPLLDGLGVPSALLCEAALEAAGVPAAPGATEIQIAPEHLWATFKHWHDQLGESIQLRGWRLVRDEASRPLPALSMEIPESLHSA